MMNLTFTPTEVFFWLTGLFSGGFAFVLGLWFWLFSDNRKEHHNIHKEIREHAQNNTKQLLDIAMGRKPGGERHWQVREDGTE
jgi:hypothetical protein